MNKSFVALFLPIFLLVNLSGSLYSDEPFDIKGFYLGMTKQDVKSIYEKFEEQEIARHLSMESEDYRDLIKIDNEMSSMGNKIEISYGDSLKANSITFQYKAVEILFDYGDLEVEKFVEAFKKEYEIPEMEFKDMGMIKNWRYFNEELGYKILIDDGKNIRLQLTK